MIGKEILNYIIVSLIGKGGMGSVYLAEHKYIKQQKVAIKVINGGMINEFTRQKLAEEADRLARMNHPNIVHFINYHIDEAGSIYLIMEYADGHSLEDYIRNVSGLIVEERICAFFEPLLDAFEYAHKHKIVHKDIKPSNIIITNEGIPKVLDFGISALLDDGGDSSERDLIMGTPSYMSPEQVKGENLDQCSDIYSLGVLLHQMLTGNPPYDTTTLTEHEIYKQVVEAELPRMKTYYKYVSEKVQKVVDKATNKKKEARFQSCSDFKKALHNAIYPPKISTAVKVMIGAVAAAVLVGVFFIWDYNRVKISYYKDYVEQWGVPQGIGELTSSESKHREATYRFEETKRKVRRVSLVNAYGKITEHHDSEHMERPEDMQLYYNDNGSISCIKVLNKNGKVLYKKTYSDNLKTVIFQYDDENSTEFVLTSKTQGLFQDPFATNENKGKITRYLLTYDENGYVVQQEYASFFNTKVGDVDGIFARAYKRDEKGRVVEECYLGHDGSPKGNKKGLGVRRHKFDEKDDWIETAYFTIDGKQCTDGNGCPIVKIEYDQYGNRIKESYVDENDTPVLRTDCNAAGFEYTRNEQGLCVRMTYFDVEGKPCFNKEGVAGFTYEYDENGFIAVNQCVDDNNGLCTNKEGWAYTKLKNDSVGNVVEMWFYDVDNKLVETTEGHAGAKLKYNKYGNNIEWIAYGTDKKTVLTTDNVCGYLAEYNEQGFMTKLTNVDTSLKPCKNNNGVVTDTWEYDRRGNLTKISYFDENNKPILSNEKIAGMEFLYDDFGNLTQRSFFNTKKEPCLVDGKYYKVTYTYDKNGNLSGMYFYDVQNKLTYNSEGLAGYEYVCDERGNILQSTPLGVDKTLKKGWLIYKAKFDESDNEIERAYFDKNGPATNANNHHRQTCKYNSRNLITEIAYYDTKGDLVCYDDDKYAIQMQKYDSKGNRSECIYLGKKKEPVVCNEGWHSSLFEYNAQGQVIRQLFFGLDGKPTNPKVMVPEGICKYDKWGNMIYLASCDGKGNLIKNPQTGWSYKMMEYDSRGNELWESYYNEKKQGILCNDGYHKLVCTYASDNQIATKSYFDTSEKPMLVNGYHIESYKYDKNGNLLELACLGKKKEPIDCSYGFHKVVFTYNQEMEYTDRKYYNAAGKMLLHEKFDGKDWKSVTASKPVNNSGTKKNWRDEIETLAQALPMDMGESFDGLIIKSIRIVSATKVEVIFEAPKSMYDMSNSTLEQYKQYAKVLTEYIKNEASLPKNVIIAGTLKDSKGRELHTVRY